MKRTLIAPVLVLGSALWLLPSVAMGQPPLVIKPLAEKKLQDLPAGPLFWRIENVDALTQAQAAAGPWSLVAESAGKVWLFTLGPAGGSSAGGTKVTEVGPIPRIVAPQYLLRINEASGPPGSITPVHTHPGSEAFFVLAGRAKHPESARGDACEDWPSRSGARCRHAHAGLEQRLDGSACPGDVCGGRDEAVFISGHVSVSVRCRTLEASTMPRTPASGHGRGRNRTSRPWSGPAVPIEPPALT